MLFWDSVNFDNNPILWWVFGHIFLGVLGVLLILRHRPVPTWIFLTAIFFISGFMRAPVFLYDLPLNPDETQMLAQGLTLTIDPLLYRSVDPTTSGPINSYLLYLLSIMGFKLSFHLAHVLSWGLTMFALVFYYKALRYFRFGIVAQLALIPAVAFVSFIQEINYVHYYSESVAILLLSLNVYFIARWTHQKTFSYAELITSGAALALVVLCKIQALPLAFVLGVWSLVLLFLFQRQKLFLNAGVLVLTIVSVWGGWLLYLWHNGVLEDFFFYYIKANAQLKIRFSDNSYRSPFYLLIRFPLIFAILGKGIKYLVVPLVILAGAFLFKNRAKLAFLKILKIDSYFWFILLGYSVAVIATLIRTGSFYAHHFTYFMLPFCLFTGLFLSQLTHVWRWAILSTQLIFAVISVEHLVTNSSINLYETARSKQQKMSPVARAILKYANPGEYLVVWGWECAYYVETQMPQGVNENHSVRSAMAHPFQATYYRRYVSDIKRTRPKVFVDAITAQTLWMNDPAKYGHQNYPELARYIAQNYELKEVIEGVKIYAWK